MEEILEALKQWMGESDSVETSSAMKHLSGLGYTQSDIDYAIGGLPSCGLARSVGNVGDQEFDRIYRKSGQVVHLPEDQNPRRKK
jgi:hypothetical protein